MLDLRTPQATPVISHQFTLASARAMQCPALDPQTGDWYVSQASGVIKPESIVVTRNTGTGKVKRRVSAMRLIKAGHGSTISVLRRGGVLGIVTNAWGKLVWIPYRAGDVKKGDLKTKPIWAGTYAYIDHEAKTVCLSGPGYVYKLYQLVGDTLGKPIGKMARGVTSTGPNQGFCTIKSGGSFYLFTMWDYGRPSSKPTIAVGSFTTGALLYRKSARVLPKSYTGQEPESGFGLGGVFHLGMSVKVGNQKKAIAVRFGPFAGTWVPPVKPPVPVPPVPPVILNPVQPPPVIVPARPPVAPPVNPPVVSLVPLQGNDVASYQPLWSPKPTDGFAFVKATQGLRYANPYRARQLSRARKLNLQVGHYHFQEPGNAVLQARHFVAKADIRPGDLLWCDWEGDWSKKKHPSVEDAAAFIREVQRLKPENLVGLYCNRSDWVDTKVKAGDGLWVAEYGVKAPGTVANWAFWQYSETPIDQNISRYTSMVALKAWANSKRKAL